MDTIVKVMDLDLLLKGDRMSLYSADLLRSDSLFYWLRAFFVIYKK
jgi:hypothetical protein